MLVSFAAAPTSVCRSPHDTVETVRADGARLPVVRGGIVPALCEGEAVEEHARAAEEQVEGGGVGGA